MPTQMDIRQSVLRSALNMAGTAANATVDGILIPHDAEIGKLFEDRNILLTDGGSITFTGTQLQFTENLNITLNQKISGAVPQVISLGSANQNFASSGDMWVAVINRTAGTATTSIILNGSALPAVSNANQEVFLIAKRVDAGDGTQRIYWRNGFSQNAGQTLRLGQGGGSGGTGTGSDLGTLQFRAQFVEAFTESASNAASAVNGTAGFTNAVYNASKSMYTILYDASRTINTTGTAATLSGTPSFTVAAGDVVINLATGDVRKITAISSQTAYTLESAFATNLAAQSVCVSQAVHTKDIYNYAGTGAAISAAFPSAPFSEIMVDYEDNATTNSNLWTPDVAPFAAFVASTDNSTWTTVAVRSTNETDIMQSVICPTVSSGLYIRFFSDKSSGTGFVNLIMYEAFMQKALQTSQGGIVWSAYAMLDSSTTPVNCTVAVVGGKSTITFTNQYPIGVNTGQSWGSLDVYVNGQQLPRFISGSVPSTDGYYTELSGNALQLDSDYSSKALDIQVILRTQIVDTSTTNTTSLSAIQEEVSVGFQSFTNTTTNTLAATTTTGTPAAGTFYSTITNRASMTDLSQDLKPRMGITRMMTQDLAVLQGEFGPNGEQVYSISNDTFGQMRLVGFWTADSSNTGVQVVANTADTSSYAEITFYGTGLNILAYYDSNTRTQVASTDGGAEGANYFPGPTSTLLSARNYGENTPISVVSGLTLGIHTVKVRNTSAFNFPIFGFEIVNSNSTNVVVPAGVSYIAGKKLASTSQSTFAYNSVVTGTRGGRVIVYQAQDGTIGKAWRPTNAAQANLSSADHTNEEVVRVYNFREFGANRADDFSSLGALGTTRAFVLDDGTTSLVCDNAASTIINYSNANYDASLGDALSQNNATAAYSEITFVGTGLDITMGIGANNTTTSLTVVVDGTSIGTQSLSGLAGKVVTFKIVSGLPYGTHLARISTNATGSYFAGVKTYTVYQPKKPSLPSGSVELGGYNVLATYTANATAGINTVGTGVLRKLTTREVVLSGTWSATLASTELGGWQISSTTTGDFIQYTFFGTGFDWRFSNNATTATWQIAVDGSTALNGFTTSSYGAGITSFTASTGTLVSSTTATVGNGISVSNLTLGLHTVKISKTAGTGTIRSAAFDLVTPIYSSKSNLYEEVQNTMPVGSNGINDHRLFVPVKDQTPVKAWSQAMGVTSGPTTTSAVPVPLPEMSCVIRTSGNPIQIDARVVGQVSTQRGFIYLYVDGIQVGIQAQQDTSAAGDTLELSNQIIAQVSAGAHKIDVYWSVNGGATFTAVQTQRILTVREL